MGYREISKKPNSRAYGPAIGSWFISKRSGDYNGHIAKMPGPMGSLYHPLPPGKAIGNYAKIMQPLPVRIEFDCGQDLSQLRPGMSVEPKVGLR